MFGSGYGRGRGRGAGRGPGAGFGRGMCWAYYQEHGEWPAWSRWAGGPGYWRYAAVQGQPPDLTEPAAQEPVGEVAALRQEVAELRQSVEALLEKLG